jgi:tetratricopeptide (TPR) repeat protein/tRNA A-37 threonylcarbamoyl transferase component Bud32
MNETSILDAAREKPTPAERAAFLDEACAGDPTLRARLEALLRPPDQPGSSGDQPATEPGATGQLPTPDREALTALPAAAAGGPQPEGPGTRVGPYLLLEKIGQGGMGVVYLAEQEQPVRRRVALKLIKAGMDSAQVVRRFEAERQALALMDHPAIARVFDAGTTAAGRPFFAMELVRGVPITRYCDDHRLTVRERLGLFLAVCQAVQHAHQKGVIHRDVKPSNVLVAVADGRPAPKVIDFGVAKAVDEPPAGETLCTQVGTIVGTFEYMAPEQAELTEAGVDTRCDIYSLGVLLYELLTGTTPLERARLKAVPVPEALRLIREEEPPPPSGRLAGAGPRLPAVAAARGTEPARLVRLVRGELDWIAMRCLEKDRSRRYDSAAALARDVGRHLADEPVEAGPPSAGYRLRKLARRHRTALATAALFVALLLAGTAVSTWQAVRATLAEREATAARRAEADQARRLAEAQREEERKEVKQRQDVNDALHRATALRERARAARGPAAPVLAAKARDQARRAQALLENGPADPALAAQVRRLLADLDEQDRDRQLLAALDTARLAQAETVRGQNRFASERAVPLLREAFRAYGLPAGQGRPADVAARIRSRPPAVRDALVAALDEWVILAEGFAPVAGEAHLPWLRSVLAAADPGGLGAAARAAAAEPDAARRRQALEKLARGADVTRLPAGALTRLARRLRGAQAGPAADALLRRAQAAHPGDFWVNQDLGLALLNERSTDAVRYLTAAVALRPDSPGAHLNLGYALERRGEPTEAAAEYRRALDLDAKYSAAHNNLGNVLLRLGKADEGLAAYRRALALSPRDPMSQANIGHALLEQGKAEEAAAAQRRALEFDRRYVPAHVGLGNALAELGQMDKALAAYRQALSLDPSSADAHYGYGRALVAGGQVERGLAEIRRGIELEPNEPLGYLNLGQALQAQGKAAEAAAAFRRALAVDPKNFAAHNNLGIVLGRQGQLAEALAEIRQALALAPNDARAHNNLGILLGQQGKLAEAEAAYHRSIALDPRPAPSHVNLGNVLKKQGKLAGAAAAYRAALDRNAKDVLTRLSLGEVLLDLGRVPEAAAELRRVLELDPKNGLAHGGLGLALDKQGKPAEALAAHRRAVALAPESAPVHRNFGITLVKQGRLTEGIAEIRQALDLDPKSTEAHSALGVAYAQQGRLDEAVAAYRRAVALDPRHFPAHLALGMTLFQQGHFAEARASMRRGLDLLPSSQLLLRASVTMQLRQCERLLDLERKLPAVLAGQSQPADASERLEYARFAAHKGLYAGAAGLFAAAFAADPRAADNLTAGHRYNAACTAAAAAAGQGLDANKLSEQERARWREQALGWLRADLAKWAGRLKDGGPAAGKQVAAKLRSWQQDAALAGIRDAAPVARLPEGEREACRRLWADVDGLVRKAQGG